MLNVTHGELFAMTLAQREALAGFIMTFPTEPSTKVANMTVSLTADTKKLQAAIKESIASIVTAEPLADPASLFGNVEIPAPVADIPDIPAAPATIAATPALTIGEPVKLDSDGLPWDDRIHASSKGITQDGKWRQKRGVDKTLLVTVEAELRKLMNIPAPPAAATATQTATTATVTLPSPVDRKAFVDLVTRVSDLIVSGKLKQGEVDKICQQYEIPNLPALGKRPEFAPFVREALDELVKTR